MNTASVTRSISGRLSLRAPQREALEILDRISTIIPIAKRAGVDEALAIVHSEYPTVADFERDFPSLCFALATGVGKTRLMGAFISYLHLAHGINNFFVMAPNLTIYNKLITDFTPNTPKYVFKGIGEFATNAPAIVTGDNYENMAPSLFDLTISCRINIFNISKINSEVRGGRAPRIKRLSEYIGQSYFEHLAALPDLVLIMDESHRYRASAGIRAINELKPVLGLELTATPFVETTKAPVPFKNVILDYPLGKAMTDGFVKEPAVVTRRNFSAAGMRTEEIERLKLEDGVRLHEQVKVELETYARETNNRIVKPFVLVIARDTTHAKELVDLISSPQFFDGRYANKVIQVDSSKTGEAEDEMVARLLAVEHTEEPTEIVVHVNMLKEGWDVTNLYTIVPLRAANARTLIEQSIGRGLRLPYGKRTGVTAVDRLNIVAHDRFQEIVDEAGKPGSTIRLQQVILDANDLEKKTETLVVPSKLAGMFGEPSGGSSSPSRISLPAITRAFEGAEESKIARLTLDAIKKYERQPDVVPSPRSLSREEVQRAIVDQVNIAYRTEQIEFGSLKAAPDVAAIVATTTRLVQEQTISIPRINVIPKGTVTSGFHPFTLDLKGMRYQPVSNELHLQHLRTRETEVIAFSDVRIREERLEDYVVSGLVDFDDVSYDAHADLLYDLAGQVVRRLSGYLSDENEVRKVLVAHQREIAKFVHAQMLQHHTVEDVEYEVKVSGGYTEIKPQTFSVVVSESVMDHRNPPVDKSNMARYLFGKFNRCLYPVQRFQSDTERRMAVILDRDSSRWFKPVKGQFQLFYRNGAEQPEYVPDFVAETPQHIYMVETKARNEMEDEVVQAKKTVAVEYCARASNFTSKHAGEKPWSYVLVPHDGVDENFTLDGIAGKFG